MQREKLQSWQIIFCEFTTPINTFTQHTVTLCINTWFKSFYTETLCWMDICSILWGTQNRKKALCNTLSITEFTVVLAFVFVFDKSHGWLPTNRDKVFIYANIWVFWCYLVKTYIRNWNENRNRPLIPCQRRARAENKRLQLGVEINLCWMLG